MVFKKKNHFSAMDESSLSIGRVKLTEIPMSKTAGFNLSLRVFFRPMDVFQLTGSTAVTVMTNSTRCGILLTKTVYSIV